MTTSRKFDFDGVSSLAGGVILLLLPFSTWWILSLEPDLGYLSRLDQCEKSEARDRIAETGEPLTNWGVFVVSRNCRKKLEDAPIINEQLQALSSW